MTPSLDVLNLVCISIPVIQHTFVHSVVLGIGIVSVRVTGRGWGKCRVQKNGSRNIQFFLCLW